MADISTEVLWSPCSVDSRCYIKPCTSTKCHQQSLMELFPHFYIDLRCYIKPCASTKFCQQRAMVIWRSSYVDLRCYIKPCASTKVLPTESKSSGIHISYEAEKIRNTVGKLHEEFLIISNPVPTPDNKNSVWCIGWDNSMYSITRQTNVSHDTTMRLLKTSL